MRRGKVGDLFKGGYLFGYGYGYGKGGEKIDTHGVLCVCVCVCFWFIEWVIILKNFGGIFVMILLFMSFTTLI